MGTYSKIKNKIKKTVKKVGGSILKPAKSILKPIKSILKPEKVKDEPEVGTRGEAATQLIKQGTTRQAGSGQVSFTEEKEI